MRILFLLTLTALANAAAFPWSLQVQGNVGFVSMNAFNEWLSALAARQEAEFLPLRLGTGLNLALWPWPFLGIAGEALFASGKIVGREAQLVSAAFLGVSGKAGFEFDFMGVRFRAEAGLGGIWSWTGGPLEGGGLGWCASLCLGGRLVRLGPLEIWAGLGYRWAQVAVLHTPRGEFRPRTGPALDFSGLFGGVEAVVQW